ncbi:hypothetical protein [Nannocystis sp.]|uniref:hypothetical protein n=1 Tax=Nannocystis sp. TaxID=1962667 RepID=UPI0025D67BC4|nr:hypothetical protein [Nannocystis sp.]MBK7823659.1 hypothetical protein [Nannocystis sp.]
MSARHPWILTGPWYRWQHPGVAASGRLSAPALHAFASPGFVDEFLREPQRSLADRPDDHANSTRKLFLASHRRFYIVACELHCDAPGFPGVARDQVCEAGFVIRKHQLARTGTRATGTRAVGWIPNHEHPNTGAWIEVDAAPDTRCDEQIHHLFPLVPPPGNNHHSAHGRTIFFAAVPTGSAATTAAGTPRFDTTTALEIRCFVRRHRDGCPRRSTTPDCHGELVWSRPSEPFRIAAPLDVQGVRHDPAMARAAARLFLLQPWLKEQLGSLAPKRPNLDDAAMTTITSNANIGSDLSPPLVYRDPVEPPSP